jgi:hypothetical protein
VVQHVGISLTVLSASMPATPASASRSLLVVIEEQRRVEVRPNCRARHTCRSLPGDSRRTAMTARQAGEDALRRGLGCGANGIP